MKIIRSLKYLSCPRDKIYMTLGNFDGLHVGHQAIIKKMVSEARKEGGIPVLFTFIRHPLSILVPSRSPLVITPFKKKMSLLKEMGVEWVVCIPFTRHFSQISAEEFIRTIIHKTFAAKKIFTGPNYTFGRSRQGSPELLKAKADQYGYSVEIVDAVYIEEMISSSTNIRQRILSGEVDLVCTLLGRSYSIQGRVVHGTQKGNALGIRTATLQTHSKLIPGEGVYAVRVDLSGTMYLALTNIGRQPTFGDYRQAIETYILDFDKDIYGQKMDIHFLKRIRAEKSFKSTDELRKQIGKDIRFVTTNYEQ